MQLFSTIFFVDGNPVKYDVRADTGRLLLLPIDNPNQYIFPPILYAYPAGETWTVDGTADRDLIDQVIEDVLLFAHSIPPFK